VGIYCEIDLKIFSGKIKTICLLLINLKGKNEKELTDLGKE